MSNPCTQLAEALAILGTLAATANGQQIERLDPPVGYQRAEWGEPAISGDGNWIALVIDGPDGYAVERRHGPEREILGARVVSGVTTLKIANDGSVQCNVIRLSEGEWTRWSSVGPVRDHTATTLYDVSDDGQIQVVTSGGTVDLMQNGAYVRMIGGVGEWGASRATATSSDAWVVVGESWLVEAGEWRVVPWLWRGLSPQVLSRSGWPSGSPHDVSSNGAVVSGFVSAEEIRRPAIWIGRAAPIVIETEGYAELVTSEGRMVFVSSAVSNAVWTPWTGVVPVTHFGFPSDEPARFHVVSTSNAGDRLLAWHQPTDDINSGGWVLVTLPPPCHLDYATDGMIDFFDYFAFVACFEGDCPNYRSADFNMDGFLDWADYAGFVEAFEIGC